MESAIREVMESCNLSYEDAEREIKSASEMLLSGEFGMSDVEDFCLDLGIEEDTLFDNPEMLLAYL